MSDSYDAVNAAWPAELPVLTRDEARRASRRLARHFGGRPRREPRRCWIRVSPPYNTPTRGWRRLVHDVSHSVWTKMSPASKSHNKHHAELERQMIEYVVNAGWLDGKLKSKVCEAKALTPEQKLDRVLVSMKRWETKRKRADTAIKKLRKRVRYYERAVGV